jgi:hypothetical protein
MKARLPVPKLSQRRLVWKALSNLYLDAELGDDEFKCLAKALADTGFAWSEILQINYDEVGPALYHNLFNYVGQWSGWPEPELSDYLTTHYSGRPARLFWSRRLWRWLIDYFTAEWLAKIEGYFQLA